MPQTLTYSTKPRLTKLEAALAERLRASSSPVVTPYQLFQELRKLFESNQKLHTRKGIPDQDDLGRRRRGLLKAGIIFPDRDYKNRAYRILENSDRPTEEICCIVDRFCYVSHLSAMARFGLTDRRPRALHMTAPHQKILPNLLRQAMLHDYGEHTLQTLDEHQIVSLQGVNHPKNVRGRETIIFRTINLGDSIPIRDSFARIATIGQTFVDMLEEPGICGGMAHVLDVWREHAGTYLDDIITTVQNSPRTITKIRAGYIIDELIGMKDERVERWKNLAQRGSSRVLDPTRPFAPQYSEKWMISLNVA
ncbi:hypothetical protein H0Z60_03900 [Ectothiorhodospiraceae bacterium WFHF3C12]|nr:hypothetical protein [Ectothiorhodospiraceae bacterium WFHF3C12]